MNLQILDTLLPLLNNERIKHNMYMIRITQTHLCLSSNNSRDRGVVLRTKDQFFFIFNTRRHCPKAFIIKRTKKRERLFFNNMDDAEDVYDPRFDALDSEAETKRRDSQMNLSNPHARASTLVTGDSTFSLHLMEEKVKHRLSDALSFVFNPIQKQNWDNIKELSPDVPVQDDLPYDYSDYEYVLAFNESVEERLDWDKVYNETDPEIKK